MGVPRPDTHVLAYLALRITFANARACEGAPAGLRRGLDCSQRTHGGRGEGRFVPLEPGKRQPLTRVRPLRIAEGDRYERHPDASRLRLVCGGNVCVGESRTVGILAKHSLRCRRGEGLVGIDRRQKEIKLVERQKAHKSSFFIKLLGRRDTVSH
jgi:hypothetical protein